MMAEIQQPENTITYSQPDADYIKLWSQLGGSEDKKIVGGLANLPPAPRFYQSNAQISAAPLTPTNVMLVFQRPVKQEQPPAKQQLQYLRLIIDSDLHFTESGIRADKTNHAQVIREIAARHQIDAIICAGDLTDMGWDGKRFLCWRYGGAEDQVTPLRRWVEGLEADVAPVFLASGNHDQYVPWPYRHKGVRDYIETKHRSLLYNWEYIISDGVNANSTIKYRGVCLDVYPDKKAREYLSGVMNKWPNDRYIIYFHYNLEGDYSDWWSDSDKTKFANMLSGRNIALIICGHLHKNALTKWRGYNVAMGAGSKVAEVIIASDGSVALTEH